MSKLTKAAKNKPCMRCGTQDGTICSRHYNGTYQHWYGKGIGVKCNDLASADLCHECDKLFSEGISTFETRTERDAEFLHLCMMTNIRRMEDGVLKV